MFGWFNIVLVFTIFIKEMIGCIYRSLGVFFLVKYFVTCVLICVTFYMFNLGPNL